MWKNEWILILIMNVNQFSVMITILVSITHAHAKVELESKKKSPSNQRTLRHQFPQSTHSISESVSKLLDKRVKRRLSHSRELLQRLIGLSKQRLLAQKIRKGKRLAKKTTNTISTNNRLKKSQRIAHLRKQIHQHLHVIPGKDFMRALASKVLAHSLTYRHMHGTKRNVTTTSSLDTAMPSVQKIARKKKTKQRALKPHTNDVDEKNKAPSAKPKKHLESANESSSHHPPPKRKHRLQYLTDLIYKVNRFYSKIWNRNASQHSNVLHIPFKRREVTKLRKLFMSLIDKENVLHIKNTSLIGESSRAKLRSFVHLLNQLDKTHNSTRPGASGGRATNLPFDVEIESHNTTRKDFVVWDDDQQDDSMRQNMVDYMNDRINDLGNRPYDVNDLLSSSRRFRGNDRVCYRCRIPGTRVGAGYGTGAILSEETSTGYADEDFDVELDHLNKKIEHYVLGRKSSPIINEYKEIEDSEKESEWNNVRDYSQIGGGAGKWWEKQIYPTAEQGLEPEPDGTERGYKYGAVSGSPPTEQRILRQPQQSQYEYNDLYDFSLINRAINGYV